jgi:DNA-binding Lrp family transcriptional regulator
MRQSTLAVIRQRLRKKGYYRLVAVPLMQNIGCEMLALIHTDFNPMVPLDERIQKTSKVVEASPEIFFSLGELQKGFSLSFSKNYTELGKINDTRTTVFGGMQLIEKEYPKEMLFPFEASTIYRFLNFAPLVASHFGIKLPGIASGDFPAEFRAGSHVSLSETEKLVYNAAISKPESSFKELATALALSVKTVSHIKFRLQSRGLLKTIAVPDLKKLGLEILALHLIRFNPQNPPTEIVRNTLTTDHDILVSLRKFEGLRISIYPNYDQCEIDRMQMFRYLRQHNYVVDVPFVRTFSLTSSAVIKDFNFAPAARKILGIRETVPQVQAGADQKAKIKTN